MDTFLMTTRAPQRTSTGNGDATNPPLTPKMRLRAETVNPG